MVALSRFGLAVLLHAVAEGARFRKRFGASSLKFIAGVPVLNYDSSYAGKSSLGEMQEEREWVVVVKEGTSSEQLHGMCRASKNSCNLVGDPSKGGVPFLEMRGTEDDLEHVIQSAGGAVRYAEPDQEVSMIPEIDADMEAATWGLNRIGADQRGRAGIGVTVFVLDTGVRTTHEEFGGRAASAFDMSSGKLVECNGDLTCANDMQGHGTHCAGTAVGATYGVAPLANVRSGKVLGDNGSGSWSWSYGALDWLATNPSRPAVASMSLGGSGTQQAMKDAVDAAVNAGVAVVVAAGNSDSDACHFSPAWVPSAITVGSTDATDRKSSFSNYGFCTDIWAPGRSVLSAGHTSDSATATFSGTSMACPHVSGAAALVLEADPSKKAPAILQQLLGDAYLNAISDLRAGDTDALLCIAEGGAPPSPTSPPTPAPPPGSWAITGTGCEMDGECIQSRNYPSNYGNDESCNVEIFGEVTLAVDCEFSTEADYDKLIVNGDQYHGSPPKNLADLNGNHSGYMSWRSDSSDTHFGWRICKTDGASPAPTPCPPPAPTPQPTPAPPTPYPGPPRWEVSGSGCYMRGICIRSNNEPGYYGDNQECTITLHGDIPLVFPRFDTEEGHDFLTVHGRQYSGTIAPLTGVYTGAILWASDEGASDGNITKTGWRFCRTD